MKTRERDYETRLGDAEASEVAVDNRATKARRTLTQLRARRRPSLSRRSRRPLRGFLILRGICLAGFPIGCGWASIAIGQDLNPDTLNYHLYNAWAFLNGQDLGNVFPAGAQSLLNPFIEVPFYLLRFHTPPLFAAFVTGAWQGLAPMFVYLIARRITKSRLVALFAGIAAAIAGGFLSELGSQMGDSTVAPFFLAAIFCVIAALELRGKARSQPTGSPESTDSSTSDDLRIAGVSIHRSTALFGFAGILAGVGAGLKLAEVSIGVAIVVATPFIVGSWRNRLRFLTATGLGFIFGIAATAGYWSYFLWRHYGDPFAFTDGPLWIFHSPYFPASGTGQYTSPDYTKYLWFPIKIFFHPSLVSEIPVREASVPIAWGLLLSCSSR